MQYAIRRARPEECSDAERVARAAFRDYEAGHGDWYRKLTEAQPMRVLGETAEILIAVSGENVVGAVGYMAPGIQRHDFFPPEWAILRMLSVPPEHRGHGIGRALVKACIDCARRDKAGTLGLYTSPVMKTAVPLYLAMGFVHLRKLPAEDDVPCDLYALEVG